MNKSELAKAVQHRAYEEGDDFTLKDVTALVNHVFNVIGDQVSTGDKVSIHNFGAFSKAYRRGRMGKNPHTGEPLQIPAMYVAKFKPAKGFKDKLNE